MTKDNSNRDFSETDDIIKQHKTACLRVTSLQTCKELLWIGTSAGVVLTMPMPVVKESTTRISSVLHPVGKCRNGVLHCN